MDDPDIPQELRCAALTKPEHVAIKAFAEGEADAGQQAVVMRIIVKNFSRTTDLSYIPGSPGGSTFLSGRMFVGYQLLKYINTPVEVES